MRCIIVLFCAPSGSPALELLGQRGLHGDALQIDGRVIRMGHEWGEDVWAAIPVNWPNILRRRRRLLHVTSERYAAAHFDIEVRRSGNNRLGIWRRYCDSPRNAMKRAQNWLIAFLGAPTRSTHEVRWWSVGYGWATASNHASGKCKFHWNAIDWVQFGMGMGIGFGVGAAGWRRVELNWVNWIACNSSTHASPHSCVLLVELHVWPEYLGAARQTAQISTDNEHLLCKLRLDWVVDSAGGLLLLTGTSFAFNTSILFMAMPIYKIWDWPAANLHAY